MMIDNTTVGPVFDALTLDAFYSPIHREIAEAIQSLYLAGTPAGADTVAAELERCGQLENAGGLAYLAALEAKVLSPVNAMTHARIVTEKSNLRRLIESAHKAIDEAYHENESGRIITALQRRLAAVAPPPPDLPESLDDPAAGLPEFPLEPIDNAAPWLDAFIREVARETQTPLALAGCMSLATIATVLGPRVAAFVRPGWVEQPALFVLVAMRTGTRKSPVFTQCAEPLLAHDRDARDENDRRRRENEVRLEVAEARLASAMKGARAGDEKAVEQAVEIKSEIDTLKVPPAPVHIPSDVTAESLAVLMERNGGWASILTDEAGVLRNLGGRYQNGQSNWDIALTGYSGNRPFVRERVTSTPVWIASPCLTIGLTIQVSKLVELGRSLEVRDNGLLARFVFAMPREIGVSDFKASPLPMLRETRNAYRDRLRGFLRIPLPEKGVRAFREDRIRVEFGADARRKMEEILLNTKARSEPTHPDFATVDALGKRDGLIVRLATILHVLRHDVGGGDPLRPNFSIVPVAGETVDDAKTLADFFFAHGRRAYSLMGAESTDELSDARALRDWLKGTAGAGTIDVRAVAKGWGRRRPDGATEAALRVLERARHIEVSRVSVGPGPARRVVRLLSNPPTLADNADGESGPVRNKMEGNSPTG